MSIQTQPVSFSDFYKNDNLSENSLGLVKGIDKELTLIKDQFDKKHIASTAVPGLEKIRSKILEILTSKDQQLLNRLPTDARSFSEKFRGIFAKVLIKQVKSEPLDAMERAVKHHATSSNGLNHLKEINEDFKKAWTLKKRQFDSKTIGRYPLLDLNGNILRIREIDKKSADGLYTNDQVKPFISSFSQTKGGPPVFHSDKRAALYSKLAVEPFTKSDLKDPLQADLVGQNKVVAKEKIDADTCIGIYDGTFLPEDLFPNGMSPSVLNSEYTAQLFDEERRPNGAIDGEGILSRMNTVYEKDKYGVIEEAQDPKKYNVTHTKFLMTVEDEANKRKFKVYVPTFFTTRDIEAGEELVWKYGKTVRKG